MRFGAHGVHARIHYNYMKLLLKTYPSSLNIKALKILTILGPEFNILTNSTCLHGKKKLSCVCRSSVYSPFKTALTFLTAFLIQVAPKWHLPCLTISRGLTTQPFYASMACLKTVFQANHAFHRSPGKPGRTATHELEGSWFTSQLQKMCKTYTERVQPPDGRTQLIGGVGSNTWPPAGWYSSLQPQGVKCSTQNQSWVSLAAEQSNNLWYHMAQTIF